MPWATLAIILLGAGLGTAGIGSLLWAVFGPARVLRNVPPSLGRCACCGYSLAGLEDECCPECGANPAAAAASAHARRRRRLGMCGLGATIAALICWPLADASRFGVAHALPNLALVEWLRFNPSSHAAITAELQTRVDSGYFRAWERRELARVCARLLDHETSSLARRDVAWLLARLGADTPADSLAPMMSDRDAAVRALGIEATRRQGPTTDATRGVLSDLVLHDRSALVRRRAIDAMRAIEDGMDGRARSTILLALDDPSDGVRQSAVCALVASGDASAEEVRAVCGRTADPSEDVRWCATAALARLDPPTPEALAVLAGSLDDASPMVRATAASAIGQLACATRRPEHAWMLPRLLASALGDSDDMVREVARNALRAYWG